MNETILGYPVTTEPLQTCVEQVKGWIDNGSKAKYLVCANPHSLEVAGKDRLFHEAIENADLIVPDGAGIVLASKILNGSIHRRITGMDIFLGLNAALNSDEKYGCFLLGSTEENLAKVKEKLENDFPGIRVLGMFSPPFKVEFSEEDDRKMIVAVNETRPDLLWVGMTAPKQEKWIYRNREKLDVKFIGAVGAVFDFYTGRVKRSHSFFQMLGLEWLPRLIREPRRLWRRNFISSPSFLFRVIRHRYLERKTPR